MKLRELITLLVTLIFIFFSCGRLEEKKDDDDKESLRQVLYIQSLYNHHPGEDIVPEITNVVDSMRRSGRSPYYFAALNVLIDRLFSDGRFAEADSLAVRMKDEAESEKDSVAMAMALRVRGQMYYKLAQPSKAQEELELAAGYIGNPIRNKSEFGTATSCQEWLWIISRELGDTVKMNDAGRRFAEIVEEYEKINDWKDPTGHFLVSAMAFKAEEAFTKKQMQLAKERLDSASKVILPDMPSRAYEHLYAVRSRVRASDSDWKGAIEDVDTLLSTHKDFPWFYLNDLLLKAEILSKTNRHEESAEAYSNYIAFHDSLTDKVTSKRLKDLTVLYRTEIDQEQKRTERFRIISFVAVILFLVIILSVVLLHMIREKKRNRLLVERLKEHDKAEETVSQMHMNDKEPSLIERIDRYMITARPYTNPGLSRKELAIYADLSQEALGQLIKKEKGLSVHNYINSFRLEEVRKILGSDSNEGIAELATRLGFGTARTLQRAFKERYGMSPTLYREASQDIENSDSQ